MLANLNNQLETEAVYTFKILHTPSPSHTMARHLFHLFFLIFSANHFVQIYQEEEKPPIVRRGSISGPSALG